MAAMVNYVFIFFSLTIPFSSRDYIGLLISESFEKIKTEKTDKAAWLAGLNLISSFFIEITIFSIHIGGTNYC